MAVYRVLPCIPACKKPIPPFVDILVMLQTKTHQQIEIRIPLDMISNAQEDNTQLNIRTSDLKPVILTLFKKNGVFHMLDGSRLNAYSTVNDFRLCWRAISSLAYTEDDDARDQFEWINDQAELIGPQLIEQVRSR